ncbi:MAG: copper chaperone PCu(A)C [Alphaproteobacteria bacterium]|nr:copper chaperone PCu(A)C [Alphaproteobacteria bacterium]
MIKIFRTFFISTPLMLGLASCAFADGSMMIMKPTAAASLTPGATTGAAYLDIINMGKEADNLLRISTPAADMAMLHESKDENGVMKMEMLDKLEIPAGATVKISPGHLHIMLMGLKAPLKEGDHVALDLVFEKASNVKVDAVVKKVGDILN